MRKISAKDHLETEGFEAFQTDENYQQKQNNSKGKKNYHPFNRILQDNQNFFPQPYLGQFNKPSKVEICDYVSQELCSSVNQFCQKMHVCLVKNCQKQRIKKCRNVHLCWYGKKCQRKETCYFYHVCEQRYQCEDRNCRDIHPMYHPRLNKTATPPKQPEKKPRPKQTDRFEFQNDDNVFESLFKRSKEDIMKKTQLFNQSKIKKQKPEEENFSEMSMILINLSDDDENENPSSTDSKPGDQTIYHSFNN